MQCAAFWLLSVGAGTVQSKRRAGRLLPRNLVGRCLCSTGCHGGLSEPWSGAHVDRLTQKH